MTNLTDEGLRELARKALGIKEWDIWGTQKEQTVTSALQQVRDAAKKETVERCAKVAEDYGNSLIGIIKTSAKSNTPYHLKSQGTAKGSAIGAERIATAIRQMDGGK